MASTLNTGKVIDPLQNLTTIEVEDKAVTCIFCKSSKIDKLNLGDMYRRDDITTHYFCMLFSSALKQNGADDEGIMGFLREDILKEVRRGSRIKCVYCGAVGATVGCCNKRCRNIFHYHCGLEKNASFQFHSKFESYCSEHIKQKKTIPQNSLKEPCPICIGPMKTKDRLIRATCCKLSTFHKQCIQKMAISAGYFFKCPMCNTAKEFIHEMRCSGVYVPEQDASWEKGNAFQELYERYSNCDARKCQCKEGRQHVSDKGSWSLAVCRLCGGAGVHKHCGSLRTVDGWACAECLEIEQKAQLGKKNTVKSSSRRSKVADVAGPSSSRKRSMTCSSETTNPVIQSNSAEIQNVADDRFKWTDIRISKTCFSYFPYSKFTLRKIKGDTLTDWRTLALRVNLVRWIPPPSFSVPPPLPMDTSSTHRSRAYKSRKTGKPRGRRAKKRPRRKKSKTIEEMEAEEVAEEVKYQTVSVNVSTEIVRECEPDIEMSDLSQEDNTVNVKEGEVTVTCETSSLDDDSPPPESVREEESDVTMVDLSQDTDTGNEEEEPNVENTFPPVMEPTPEEVNSLIALGNRVRTELNLHTNNNRDGSECSSNSYLSSAKISQSSHRDLSPTWDACLKKQKKSISLPPHRDKNGNWTSRAPSKRNFKTGRFC